MAATIFHEGAALRAAAGQLRSIVQSISGVETAIARIHGSSSPAWAGKAAEQNVQNFNKLREMTRAWIRDVDETKEALDAATQAYAATEAAQVRAVSALDTRDVF